MSYVFEKKCPKCDERLNADATRCACGWSSEGKRGEKGIVWNHMCKWSSGDLKCKNPVGLFGHGETSGVCIFHRTARQGLIAADIARDSALHDRDSYNLAAARHTYPMHDTPWVAKLKAEIESKPHKSGGSFSNMDSWISLCGERGSSASQTSNEAGSVGQSNRVVVEPRISREPVHARPVQELVQEVLAPGYQGEW